MPSTTDDAFKMALIVGSGVGVKYFGLDRAISWLPRFVHYGAAGAATSYFITVRPDGKGSNLDVAVVGGGIAGIVGGEAASFFLAF